MVILVCDDEESIRVSLRSLLDTAHDILVANDGNAALAVMKTTAIDLLITDYRMPGMTGLELIQKTKEMIPTASVMMMTAFGSEEQAVEAIRLGADDYILKPFDLTDIEHRVRRLEDLRTWKVQNEMSAELPKGLGRLVGDSKVIRFTKEFIKKVAPVQSPTLLLGPSGSGKEVVARAIHESGPRAVRPFIAINCASLSEQLMDSELFGHEKGAFTGAAASKPGKFELAKSGTLFLDEIGELSLGIQAKLLRVLQEKEFSRVGGTRSIKSDARVIAATHRDLKQMVNEKTFREDLYYRLNVVSFQLSPLCEHIEDVPLFIDYFWRRLQREMGSKVSLASETVACLRAYSYPGNVRELQNVLERLMVLGSGDKSIGPQALPPEFSQPTTVSSPTQTDKIQALGKNTLEQMVEAYELKVISRAMEDSHQNQIKAAKLLGVTRSALQYKLKKHRYQAPPKQYAFSDSDDEAA